MIMVNKAVKTIGIVSLSAGTIGEDFVKHELELGIKRLEDYGLKVRFMPNALKGIEYIKNHPEKRAEDLLQAFKDPEVDMILCAIGGDDTYRLLPYLFDNNELKQAVCEKIFLGFSDTTINHLMLHKLGLKTFYGQSFLADICEIDKDMLPYTKKYFEELITTGQIKEITPSDIWYEGRTDFSPSQLGTSTPTHKNQGFELLQGQEMFSGQILGGCIDTIFDIFDNERHTDSPALCNKYNLFPALEDWAGKILLLESSEEKMPPEKYERALIALKNTGIFNVLNGVLIGKPMDEAYCEEYKKILVNVIDNPILPIVFNINVGHALPRCIIPFGIDATVDISNQKISFSYEVGSNIKEQDNVTELKISTSDILQNLQQSLGNLLSELEPSPEPPAQNLSIEMVNFDYKEDDYKQWHKLIKKYIENAKHFEIHCWNEEVEWIELALQYGNLRVNDWQYGKIIEGPVTEEFIRLILDMPKPTDTDIYDKMTPFFNIFLDDTFQSCHYGTENYVTTI